MTPEAETKIDDNLAKGISLLFHPLLMPIYGMLIIFSAPTLMGYLPEQVKKILFTVVLMNNVMIPVMLMPFFRFRNIISSYSMEERKERIVPLICVTILYSITSYIIYRFHIPVFIKSFFIASSFLALFITIINFWWKISIHSVAAGALIALVFILSLKMYTALTWYLAGAILTAGMVLSSRLNLNSHNPPQVWTGLALGLILTALLMMLF